VQKQKFGISSFETQKFIVMKIIITAITAMLLFISCDKNNNKMEDLNRKVLSLKDMKQEMPDKEKVYKSEKSGTSEYMADTAGTPPPPPGETGNKKQPGQTQPVPNPDWDKKIIKNASLNLEVKDYKIFYSSFREKIRSLGGYVAQEEQTQSDYKIENTLVIRVPVDQFDNALTLLTSNVEKINERKISSQDVTSEYVDTKSRIEAKKQVRLRYMDFLKQAKNMEEILSVQSEINGIQEEIESATGRIEYLGHSSSFSTINLAYYQVLNSSAKDNSKPSFGTKITDAFKTGLGWIVDLFIGLVSIWPLFLLTFVLIILYKKIKAIKPKQA
jgi:Tfp pilus assembly protein PilZ